MSPQLWTFIGVIAAGVLTLAGVIRTSRSKELEASAGLYAEYRELLNTAKAEFKEDLDRERQAREEAINRVAGQMDEVVRYFADYVRWARDGATPPPPWIPDWIYQRIQKHDPQ